MSKETNDPIFKGYGINTGINNTCTCHTTSLNQIVSLIEDMTEKHSKVLVTRMDVMLPSREHIENPSRKITRALESTKREIKRKHSGKTHDPDIRHIRTTEQKTEKDLPHFHMAVMANGNAIKNGYGIKNVFQKHFERIIKTECDGLVHFSESNGKLGIMINRNSPDFEQQKWDAVYALSYMAKTRDKEHTPKGTRVCSCSLIKKRSA